MPTQPINSIEPRLDLNNIMTSRNPDNPPNSLSSSAPQRIGELDLSRLSLLQKLIISSDGTLTRMLEVILGENLSTIKLSESVQPNSQPLDALALPAGAPILRRKILLQGQSSGRNWLYADSSIALERTAPDFRAQLLDSQTPIGKLWLEHQVATFKDIIAAEQHPAGELADYFAIQPQESLLSRTYRVLNDSQPVMLITEKFPAAYFLENSRDSGLQTA